MGCEEVRVSGCSRFRLHKKSMFVIYRRKVEERGGP